MKQPNSLKLSIIFIFIFLFGCRTHNNELANTKWRLTSISVESINSLSDFEKSLIPKINGSMKMHSSFTDSVVTIYAEGKVPLICKYKLHKDSLFFINNDNTIDTQLILKLTKTNFIAASMQGIRLSSIRE